MLLYKKSKWHQVKSSYQFLVLSICLALFVACGKTIITPIPLPEARIQAKLNNQPDEVREYQLFDENCDLKSVIEGSGIVELFFTTYRVYESDVRLYSLRKVEGSTKQNSQTSWTFHSLNIEDYPDLNEIFLYGVDCRVYQQKRLITIDFSDNVHSHQGRCYVTLQSR